MDRPLIVDGGLATELEARGHVLDPRLWSAGIFLENPQAIEDLHGDYLEAGAEVLIGASYQMSFEGLARAGLDRPAAERAMRRTVEVARHAAASRDRTVLVAASVGPYGATLADGSEYRGNYGLDVEALAAFHRERFDVLASSGADLLAVETLPSLEEARAVASLISGQDRIEAWVSFSCRDEGHLRDGRPIAEAVAPLDAVPQVRAVGVNCSSPEHVAGLMDAIREVTDKPIVVYPNSGECWDAARRRWSGESSADRFCRLAELWARKGAWAIGGCCRVGPDVIRRIARSLGRSA